jgi:hypothetical protein
MKHALVEWILADKRALKAIIDALDFEPELSPRLRGVMFLGTPHRGSSLTNMASVFTGVINVAARLGSLGLAKNPLQQDFLSQLRTGSQTLRELHDTFSKRVSGLQVKSFYETEDTVIGPKNFGIVRILPFLYLCYFWSRIDDSWPDRRRNFREY